MVPVLSVTVAVAVAVEVPSAVMLLGDKDTVIAVPVPAAWAGGAPGHKLIPAAANIQSHRTARLWNNTTMPSLSAGFEGPAREQQDRHFHPPPECVGWRERRQWPSSPFVRSVLNDRAQRGAGLGCRRGAFDRGSGGLGKLVPDIRRAVTPRG